VKFSDARVDPATGMVTLRAVFPNPEHLLLPGMYVRALVQEGVRADAILVPQRAVTRNPQGQAVALVLNEQNVVEQRILDVARSVGSDWLVTSGIQAGDRLIIEGVQKVRPGGPATAVAWAAGDR
jgi:membrane fusion protein (multidrug efflux system)